ncbi:hypothetical protein QVD17_01207 [Tagetes erecta]|uniref:Uncharacterized protein n=1 Tax=Tagetes erecta TaxID=13708 RepID=A0AAD8L757_TARER|nr:hypothetical protein QVD17_01207 [Tagetes erecta]
MEHNMNYEEKQILFKLMRNLKGNGEVVFRPFSPTAKCLERITASVEFYSFTFCGNFGTGLSISISSPKSMLKFELATTKLQIGSNCLPHTYAYFIHLLPPINVTSKTHNNHSIQFIRHYMSHRSFVPHFSSILHSHLFISSDLNPNWSS